MAIKRWNANTSTWELVGTPGTVTPAAIGAASLSGNNMMISQSASSVPLTIKGASSQTADLLDVLNSSNAELFAIRSNGRIKTGTISTELDSATLGIHASTTNSSTGVSVILWGKDMGTWGGDVHYLADSRGVSGAHRFWTWDGTSFLHRAIIDSLGNIGIGTMSPSNFNTSGGKVLNIESTAINSGPATIKQGGSSAGYSATEVFPVAGIRSATEITRVAGTGANGWRGYFKVIATGHTGTIGNGINIKEFYWDGGTNAPVQISTYTANNFPTISFDNSVNHRLIILLASANTSFDFNGVVKIEWMLPIDFASSTYTLS